MATNIIKHDGRISAINGNEITITILARSACSSCEANGVCTSNEKKDKDIQTTYNGTLQWHVGELVNVTMKPSMGTKAVLFGYLYPFLVLITTLIIMANITANEVVIGLTALSGVGLYYIILWFFREKLNNSFTFELEKFSQSYSSCEV